VKRIVFFDGVCNLCNGYVQWVIKNDPKGRIQFASLQSQQAENLLSNYVDQPSKLDTIYYLKDDTLYSHSDVVLEISKDLGGIYSLFYTFKIVPKIIRDAVYYFIAKNRYRFFGKKEKCMIPKSEWKSRFIDSF